MKLFLVIAFVRYMTGGGEFFTHDHYFTSFTPCDNYAHGWAVEKGQDPMVAEVWAECIPLTTPNGSNVISDGA